jgi:hypothetical protein
VTFLQLLAKKGNQLKSCPEKQRNRDCAKGKTFSRNSTDAWNSQLSLTRAFAAEIFDIPLLVLRAFRRGVLQVRAVAAET